MSIPLILLAIPSVLIGFIGFPPEDGPYHHFIHEAFEYVEVHHVSITMSVVFGVISTVVAVGGIAVAWLMYMRGSINPADLSARFQGTYQFLLNKWYIDELYEKIFVEPLRKMSVFLWRVVDEGVIDAAVNGVATGIGATSQRLRQVQTGLVANYALAIALGMVLLLGAFLAIFSDWFV
jgi:NADH-quinone oxidoreductase subunit L